MARVSLWVSKTAATRLYFSYYPVITVLTESQRVWNRNPQSIQSQTQLTTPGWPHPFTKCQTSASDAAEPFSSFQLLLKRKQTSWNERLLSNKHGEAGLSGEASAAERSHLHRAAPAECRAAVRDASLCTVSRWELRSGCGWEFNGAAIPQAPLEAIQCRINLKSSGHLHGRKSTQHLD